MVHMAAKSVASLSEADNAVWHYDVVAVHEGQFFPGTANPDNLEWLNASLSCCGTHPVRPADLVEQAEKWANDGKTVLVSALDATFQAKPFMSVLMLIPLAENVIKLTAICTGCRKEASFTKRLSAETDVEVPYVPGAHSRHVLCAELGLEQPSKAACSRNVTQKQCSHVSTGFLSAVVGGWWS